MLLEQRRVPELQRSYHSVAAHHLILVPACIVKTERFPIRRHERLPQHIVGLLPIREGKLAGVRGLLQFPGRADAAVPGHALIPEPDQRHKTRYDVFIGATMSLYRIFSPTVDLRSSLVSNLSLTTCGLLALLMPILTTISGTVSLYRA